MKNLKMIYSLLVVLVAGLFGACANDPYTPGEVPVGPQVCISNENYTTFNITGEAGEESPAITFTRIVTDEKLEVRVLSNASSYKVSEESEELIFSIPENVVFEKGEKTAQLVITVSHPEALVEDTVYSLNFSIAEDTLTTPYGASEWTLDVKLFPWEVYKNNDAEFGKFRGGDAFTGLYDVETVMAECDVVVYKHKSKEGMYLVYDPWIDVLVPTFGYANKEEAEGEVAHTTAHLVINCVDPTKCYIEQQKMGIDVGGSVGEFMIASDYHPETKKNGLAGTLEEGVLTFPKGGILFGATAKDMGKMYAANASGAFRLVLPGCEAVDYALTVKFQGMEVTPGNKEIFVKFDFTHGADITGIKYYFAQGNVVANPAEAVAALINGTAQDIRHIEEIGAGATSIKTTIAQSEVYTIIAAPMDKNGALVEKFVAMESFFYSGIGDTGSHPCDLTVEAGKYSEFPEKVEDAEVADHNALGYTLKGKNIKTLYIGAVKNSVLTEAEKAADFSHKQFLIDEGAVALTTEELKSVNSEAGFNGVCTDLEADSDYTVLVYAVNDYEEDTVIKVAAKTGVAPVYSGELKLGKYTMTSGNYSSTFEVKSYQGSSKRFLVSNLGVEDGAEWYATYDAEKGTFTLDGTVVGREKEGNLLGVVFGDYDKEKKTVYMYISRINKGMKNDPVVFTVSEAKELSALQNALFAIMELEDKTFKTKATIGQYEGSKTTVAPYVEAEQGSGNENTEN
jgi:hypothetical protein